MTRVIEKTEIQSHLKDLIAEVNVGDEIVVSKDRTPIIRLISGPPKRKKRIPGLSTGQVWISENFDEPRKRIPGLGRGEGWISEDFDEPLPDDFWEGKE